MNRSPVRYPVSTMICRGPIGGAAGGLGGWRGLFLHCIYLASYRLQRYHGVAIHPCTRAGSRMDGGEWNADVAVLDTRPWLCVPPTRDVGSEHRAHTTSFLIFPSASTGHFECGVMDETGAAPACLLVRSVVTQRGCGYSSRPSQLRPPSPRRR
jgi:hypothetical protein